MAFPTHCRTQQTTGALTRSHTDVHLVCNSGSELAVSVHVYGTNIGKQMRHIIEVATGEVKDFVSGYDQA